MKRILERNVVSIMQHPLTVSEFQRSTLVSSAAFYNRHRLTDGLYTLDASTDLLNHYAIAELPALAVISQFRQYGDTNQAANGEWTLRYWDGYRSNWVDWITNIAVRTTNDWSSWVTGEVIETTRIRLVGSVISGSGWNRIRELEVKC